MTLRRLLTGLFALLLAAVIPGSGMAAPDGPDFAEGQIWTLHGRAKDDQPMLRIAMIEHHPQLGLVYHVGVIGVRFGPNGMGTEIGHLPLSRDALKASVIARVETRNAFPDTSEGIAMWRADAGGVFTIAVVQILDIIDERLTAPNPA